ncbi:GM21077 [Drosophila sechellia]|uniref:GM21077 n=1 Tax=Drosophila sechellia TaxID=7238 RepID=B4HSB6_DROSE|nr:GM21077 [Drosophila sechellia]
MSSSNAGQRTKLIQEKCQTLLTQMLRDEDNKYCVDCDAKGPRWASWNLGMFLCIRCAGIHRNLGVHISRVKSVNLDTWTPEQVISLQQMGNSRARAVYEAQLPDGFRRPQTDTALENFIRANPKTTQRIQLNNCGASSAGESDLLGLSSPTKSIVATSASQDLQNESFTSFLSAESIAGQPDKPNGSNGDAANLMGSKPNSLAQEEQDFFNQGSLGAGGSEKDQSGKMSKDSILALYGSAPATHNPQMNFGGFTGMAPGGYMHQQQQIPHQFMTPPNSVSMYNSPVMAAPNAFSNAAISSATAMSMGGSHGFTGAQFPSTGGSPYAAAGQAVATNLMQTNQSILSGMPLFGAVPQQQQQHQQHQQQQQLQQQHHPQLGGLSMNLMQPLPSGLNIGQPPQGAGGFAATGPTTSSVPSNLNQQFGNLNIGNVWQ